MSKPTFDVDMRAVLDAMDSRRARSRQKSIGASEVGGCRRRAAYRLSGTPVSNPNADKSKAIQGTMLHKPVLNALKVAHGGIVELKLQRPGVISGSADWLRFDPLGLPILSDLKTFGAYVFEARSRAADLEVAHDYQLHIYADMLRHGQIAPKETRLPVEPVDVVDIEVLMLCRDDGRTHTRRVPFKQSTADAAWKWLADVKAQVERDGGPQFVGRDHSGPDNSAICRGCPFATACWGWNPDTDTREPLQLDDVELGRWAVDYKAAALDEAAAKRQKDIAKAHLLGQPAQKFPNGYELKWSGGMPKWEEAPDMDAIRKLYERAGIELPTVKVNKGRAAAISVLLPKPAKGK